MIKALCHKRFEEDKDYYSLHWAITNNCNYKCDYCGVWRDEKIYPFENILEYINFIGEINHVDTVLFGGEPLVHPNILQIVGELQTDIRICTNLSRNVGFLRDMTRINDDITWVISFHYAKDDLADLYDKIRHLVDYSRFVKVKVMWDSRYKEECKKVYQFLWPLEKQYSNFKVYLDMVYHEICHFLDEDIKFFEKIQNDNRFLVIGDRGKIYTSYNEIRREFNGFPNFYGWKCYTGPKGLFIDSNGSVYRCQTKRNKGKQLFNVNKDDFTKYLNILQEPIYCDEDDFCTEVVIPRRKDGNIRSRFKGDER